MRLAMGLLVCAALTAGLAAQSVLGPPERTSALRLQGERWFQIFLADSQVGYYQTHTGRDVHGGWQFSNTTRFALQDNQAVEIIETLVFAPQAPFDLVSAEHQTSRRGQPPVRVLINRGEDGLLAARYDRGEGYGEAQVPLGWRYQLADYLGFEVWLNTADRLPGSSYTVSTVDFNRMQIVPKAFAVIERNASGYLIESAAPLESTRIQLDRNLAPTALTTSGLFRFERSTPEEALLARTRLNQTTYHIQVDQPIADHTNIEYMRLEISGAEELARIWPQARREADTWVLDLDANSPFEGGGELALTETPTYPINHPAITALVSSFRAQHPRSDLEALVTFVHQQLRYRPGTQKLNVLDSLALREGECTEFADLFTTLARALGYPTRTVIGLAYSADAPPAFAYHAWNEIEIGGRHHIVDPTWNLVRADATHIPLPENSSSLMRLLNSRTHIRFRIEQVRYFDPLAASRSLTRPSWVTDAISSPSREKNSA